MVKGSEVMQIVFSMKSRVEIMAIHYCMLELVSFKVLSHTDTVHVAVQRMRVNQPSSGIPGRHRRILCRQKNWQNSVLFLVSFMHVWYVDKEMEQNSRNCPL